MESKLALMMSTHAIHCDNIFSGKKTIELRKVKSLLKTPFVSYIYHTKTNTGNAYKNSWCDCWQLPSGEFVCASSTVVGYVVIDDILDFPFGTYNVPTKKNKNITWEYTGYRISDNQVKQTCLTRKEIHEYGNNKTIFGYHIAQAVKFKELHNIKEFYSLKEGKCWDIEKALTHPPLSWCYVIDKELYKSF